jgi:proteasome beta subunit
VRRVGTATVTIVLSLVCSDGVVIAADSQITDSDRGMSYPARKLHELGNHAAWGGSGARAVLRDVKESFDEGSAAILESTDVARALQERVLPILRHHYDNFIADIPGEKTESTPSAYVLAAGYTHDEPWIVEVNPNGMVSRYDDVGFHAIGSGAPMAQQAGALLAHFRMDERDVTYGVVAAYRVLHALTLTSPSVGGPLDICRVTAEGSHHLDDGETDEVRKLADQWVQLEQQALDDLFA